jgi:hypothetical protein
MRDGELGRIGEERQAALCRQIGLDTEVMQCRLDAVPQSGLFVVNWSR